MPEYDPAPEDSRERGVRHILVGATVRDKRYAAALQPAGEAVNWAEGAVRRPRG